MVTLESIFPFLQKETWFVALNMKDAYFHVDIPLPHRKFPQLLVGQEHDQFRVLPFGLAVTPRIFTKVFYVMVALMRCHGYTVFSYLDD